MKDSFDMGVYFLVWTFNSFPTVFFIQKTQIKGLERL